MSDKDAKEIAAAVLATLDVEQTDDTVDMRAGLVSQFIACRADFVRLCIGFVDTVLDFDAFNDPTPAPLGATGWIDDLTFAVTTDPDGDPPDGPAQPIDYATKFALALAHHDRPHAERILDEAAYACVLPHVLVEIGNGAHSGATRAVVELPMDSFACPDCGNVPGPHHHHATPNRAERRARRKHS